MKKNLIAVLVLAQAVDPMATNTALQFTPGSQFVYGSCAYKVASGVAKVVDNKLWKQIFAERMANVSGITTATYSQNSPYNINNENKYRSVNINESSVALTV